MEEKFNILNWLKGLAEGWKIFFGLVGMVTIIATVAIKYDHWRNRKADQNSRIDRWIKYDSLEHVDSKAFRATIILNLKDIKDTVRATNKGLRKNANVLFNLKTYMENKVATKEGLKEVQGIFDSEKKNLFFDQIRLDTISVKTQFLGSTNPQ